MPQCEFFPASALVLLKLQGDLDISKLRRPNSETRFDAQQGQAAIEARDYNVLVDLSEAGDINGSYANISALISAKENTYRTHRAPRRIAFWAPGDLAFGTCRMFEQMAQDRLPTEMLVTRDLAEAIEHIERAERDMPMLKLALIREDAPTGIGRSGQEALAS